MPHDILNTFISESLLEKFVEQASSLYGVRMMTYNVHQMLHLADSVRQLGPLWAHSAFVFESGNGRMVSSIHAANGAPLQILERLAVAQEVELLMQQVDFSQPVEAVCNAMLQPRHVQQISVDQGATMLGQAKHVSSLSASEADALRSVGLNEQFKVGEFFRFVLNGTVFTSEAYSREKRHQSSVIITGNSQLFMIRRILQIAGGTSTVCVLLCTEVVVLPSTAQFPCYVKECFVSRSGVLTAIQIQDICSVCVFFKLDDVAKSYLCNLPNRIERD